MEQEKINYKEVMDLGFTEEFIGDDIYFKEHGFEYSIITKKLTKKVSLDWVKDTKLCEMVRVDNNRDSNIKKRMKIKNLDHLKEIVYFFSDDK